VRLGDLKFRILRSDSRRLHSMLVERAPDPNLPG
jgi:Mg2+/Co2+ transporter CorC